MDLASFANLLGAVGLGTAAGLNAWVPLLGLGIGERLGWVDLVGPFDALGSTPALAVLAIVFVADLVGDKVVVVDHVLHAVGVVIAPVSGAIVFAAQENLLTEVHPLLAAVAGMAVGEGAHLTRSAVRPAVSAGTGGVGNPVVSAFEDLSAAMLTVLAVIAPVLAFLAACGLVVLVVLAWRRWRRRRRRQGGPGAEPGGGMPLHPRAAP